MEVKIIKPVDWRLLLLMYEDDRYAGHATLLKLYKIHFPAAIDAPLYRAIRRLLRAGYINEGNHKPARWKINRKGREALIMFDMAASRLLRQ